ncbi:hypothetical protein [Parazoarcus communis]|uniref:Uncharacterized protein n=1 Tax=Parazoarcus communis SWub3 = DSM 12120 TaxID=1121029 RepID=A0A323V0U1_9RHOO|nr:hypothetical protein [Parazoarcus communis]NMG69158.1 hypothetical protein [Parazoarcus communis SWub3 = DSM 12120]PZA18405.1 hypothetical protein DNK49_02430 [Azoarcus communis] [Parazoarcus communis SWub3 = DSM 12120]
MTKNTPEEVENMLDTLIEEGTAASFHVRPSSEDIPYEMSAKRAVGRVVRAVTYPVCANEYEDMTMRELCTLATLAHSNWEACVGEAVPDGCQQLVDSFDGICVLPGAGQIYFDETDFPDAIAGLVAKKLVKVTKVKGWRKTLRSEGEGQLVTLTKKGTELVEAIAGNLGKSLSVLEDPTTRQELLEYAGLD